MSDRSREFRRGPQADRLDLVPDRQELDRFTHGRRDEQFRVAFRRGNVVAEERVERIDTSRGAELAELHFEDCTYCTVNVAREVESVEVERAD